MAPETALALRTPARHRQDRHARPKHGSQGMEKPMSSSSPPRTRARSNQRAAIRTFQKHSASGVASIRRNTTLVNRRDGGCASACAIIWLSGRKSAIQINSHLTFHTAYDKNTMQTSEEANEYIMDHLMSVGLTKRQAWALTHAAPPAGARDATLWWAQELGFQVQEYFSLNTVLCPARWCLGKP